MKNKFLASLLTVLCITVLGACFTEWDGSSGSQGTIDIDLSELLKSPPAWAEKWVNEPETQCTVILTGSNGTLTYTVPYGDDIVLADVPSGTWSVTVELMGEYWADMAIGKSTNPVKVGTGVVAPVAVVMENPPILEKFRPAFERIKHGGELTVKEPIPLNENVNIIGTGTGDNRPTIKMETNGSLFEVKSGTLTLQNVILEGHDKNNAPLVEVKGDGAKLFMGEGSRITGNTNNSSPTSHDEDLSGGGVRVTQGGTFIMDEGEITGNKAKDGAGVKVNYGATFIMNGGKVFKNDAITTDGTAGGVHIWGGTLTMNGGEISENTSTGKAGGIYVGGYIKKGDALEVNVTSNSGTIVATVLNTGVGHLSKVKGKGSISENQSSGRGKQIYASPGYNTTGDSENGTSTIYDNDIQLDDELDI